MSEQIREFEADALADPHVHWREQEAETMKPLINVGIEGCSDVFGLMPNTKHGLKTAEQVLGYKKFAENLIPPNTKITILPILLINEETTTETIDKCVDNGIFDYKGYPPRTTQAHGIRNYGNIIPLDKYCGKKGMKRHYHPEHPSPLFDNRDAEWHFVTIADMFLNESEGQIIWEHGSDARCIPHWQEMAKSGRFSVTITPQHLLTDETDSYGDVRKTFKPSAKTIWDRQSLVQLVEQNYPWVMAGSDFAPHDNSAKHIHQGRCACGAYQGKYILPMYAHALDNLLSKPGGVEIFMNFISRNARRLHRLPPASFKVKLVRKSQIIPLCDRVGPWIVELFWAGQEILWQCQNKFYVNGQA